MAADGEPPEAVGPKPTTAVQKAALVCAHAMVLVVVVLLFVWACNADVARGFLGGLSPFLRGAWTAQGYFNWHPVFMTMAFVVCGTEAALAYRFLPFSKSVNKAIHASVHTLAVVLACLGLKATFATQAYWGGMNLYSAHSWIGILGVTLYFANYAMGVIAFARARWPAPGVKRAALPPHAALGVAALVVTAAAVCTGVDEYNTMGGDFDETEHYTGGVTLDPAKYYYELLAGCKVSNGLVVAVVLATVSTIVALADHRADHAELRAPLLPKPDGEP